MQFKDKNIVKDVSRVLNIPLADANKVNKQIDTWDEYCTSKSAAWFREKYPDVAKAAQKLLNRNRNKCKLRLCFLELKGQERPQQRY
jgi:DNA polymerase III alpha subunit